MDTNSMKLKTTAFLNKGSTRLALRILGDVALVMVGAFAGYKVGQKAGRNSGKVEGVNETLTKLGITHGDVPEVAAAWAESRAVMDNAMAQAQQPAALPA